MSKLLTLISCWNEHLGAPGMALCRFDEDTGKLEYLKTENPDLSCNCTVWNAEKKILYINNEVHNNPDYPKGGGGLVYAFRVDTENAEFELINKAESCSPCPSYISLDKTGKYLICSNHSGMNAVTRGVKGPDGFWHTEVLYDDASVVLFKINEDGSIGPITDIKNHNMYPCSPSTLHSHPHTAKMSPDGSMFACCDKGDSHIYFYAVNYDEETLSLLSEPYFDNAGASPRYCAFHPGKQWFFVNHERDLRVTAYRYDKAGHLEEINTAFAVPESLCNMDTVDLREALHNETVAPPADGFQPKEQQGFVISKDGKYLYDALNGGDAVAVFGINQETGAITLLQTKVVSGRWIRGCELSPDGRFLLTSALQNGGVSVFPVLPDGTLDDCVSRVEIRGGSYITFLN